MESEQESYGAEVAQESPPKVARHVVSAQSEAGTRSFIDFTTKPTRFLRRERMPRRRATRYDVSGATAGTPGNFTPHGGQIPYDLVDLQALAPTASPSSAWTTGQYVTLGDGSTAHWNGAAWVAGAAP